MKLFKIAHEGDRLSDSFLTLMLPSKHRTVLNRAKRPFFFKVILNTTPVTVTKDVDVKVKRSFFYKYPFTFSYKSTAYLEGYSFYKDPITKLSGFLKEEDIGSKDAGICVWADTEPKEFTIKD